MAVEGRGGAALVDGAAGVVELLEQSAAAVEAVESYLRRQATGGRSQANP